MALIGQLLPVEFPESNRTSAFSRSATDDDRTEIEPELRLDSASKTATMASGPELLRGYGATGISWLT